MFNPFKKQPKLNAQEIINQIKKEVQGGVTMRNEQPPQPEVPQVQEREINLTLINDKLNYLIEVINKVAEKAEVNLGE